MKSGNGWSNEQFAQLMARHEPELRRMILRKARDSSLSVDELLQDVRLKLWQMLQSENNPALDSSYLRKMVVSVVIDTLRRVQARQEVALADLPEGGELTVAAAQLPDRVQETRERERVLHQAISELPERRQAPTRMLLMGFNTKEIANMLKMTEATVRNLAYRGAEDLRVRVSAMLRPANDE